MVPVLQEFDCVTVCEVSASLSVLLGDLFLFDAMGGIVAFWGLSCFAVGWVVFWEVGLVKCILYLLK